MVDIAESINFGEPKKAAAITIIGVGGGGGNAVNRMYKDGMEYVDFIVCNSDRQDLEKSPIPNKIVLGPGLGCGSNPELGKTCRYADAVHRGRNGRRYWYRRGSDYC